MAAEPAFRGQPRRRQAELDEALTASTDTAPAADGAVTELRQRLGRIETRSLARVSGAGLSQE